MKRILTLAALVAALSVPSFATLSIIVGTPTVTPVGANFSWSYTAELVDSNSSRLAPPGTSCFPPGASCDGLLTIYDFAGYVPGTEFDPGADWTFVGAFTGPTPGNVTPSSDSAALFNLSWAYVGTGLDTTGGSNLSIGSFGAQSIYRVPVLGEYATRTGADSGGQFVRSTSLEVTEVPQVPEPGTVVLMGTALLGLAWFRRSRKS